MKNRLIAASILCLALASTTLHADVLYWSGNGIALGGGGTWNTTSGRWGTSSSGPFTNLWSNTISNDATLARIIHNVRRKDATRALISEGNSHFGWGGMPTTVCRNQV